MTLLLLHANRDVELGLLVTEIKSTETYLGTISTVPFDLKANFLFMFQTL